jgi:hypothetical protein
MCLAGCDRGPDMAQVSGKVFYKDGTVPKGAVALVQFSPTQGSSAEVRKGATGAIMPDGSFTLYTRRPGDGVYHGEYNASFSVLKAVMDPKQMIQPHYTNSALTPYKDIKVEDDIEDLKFEIEPLPGVKGTPPASAPTGG